MHPEIHSIKPGNCPKCGMTLVKKTIHTVTPNPNKIISTKDTTKNNSKLNQQHEMNIDN